MCSRGVFQLQKLTIFFCDFGGSSSGVREMITSPQLKQFVESNPQIKFDFICKRNHHPFVRGSYINGYNKDLPLRNYKQQQAYTALNTLRNQLGRKAFKASGSRVFHTKKSIQGQWQPNIFNNYPKAQLSKVHQIPDVVDQYNYKQRDQKNIKQKDEANKYMKLRQFTNPHRERL